MAKQVSINGYKYYAIYLAIAQTPDGQLPFNQIEDAAKKIYSGIDQKTIKIDLPGMFQNVIEQNDRLKLYVRASNVKNTRKIQADCLNRDENGKYKVANISSELWNDSVWSVSPIEQPTNNKIEDSVLTHGVSHRNRGVKPFKSYRAKLDQQMAEQKKTFQKTSSKAKNILDDSSEKAKIQFDRTMPKIKKDTSNFYSRIRGASMRIRNRFLRK